VLSEDVLKRKEDFGVNTKVVVVILATYYLDNDNDSPVVFHSKPRIGHSELLLMKSEAIVLFRQRCIFPEWETYSGDFSTLQTVQLPPLSSG